MAVRTYFGWAAWCVAICGAGTACAGADEPDEPTPAFCGGIAGFPCPVGQQCIDDPGDDCDPRSGGADCDGICVEQ
jgi:hypothetical protein